MGNKMARSAILLTILATLWIACGGRVGPTPSLSPTAHTSLPTGIINVAESGCIVDEDCAFAVRLDRCCDCGVIYSKQYVDAEPHLLLYRERWTYDYPVRRILPAICWGIHCAPCPSLPLDPICADGMCKEPEKWDEIVRLCEEAADLQMMNNCYSQAAQRAYLQVSTEKALELCSRIQGEVAVGEPGDDYCAANIGRMVLNNDANRAAAFCIDHLQQSQSRCLKEAGETIAMRNLDRGLEICEMITVIEYSDRFQKDACFHNIAVQVGKTDVAQAREICERMSERVDDCKKNLGETED